MDNPRDIKFDITARAVGWELLGNRVRKSDPHSVINAGVDGVLGVIRKERALKATDKGELREKTRWSLQKVLRFRGREGLSELHKKAEDHIVRYPLYRYCADDTDPWFRTRYSRNPSL